MVIKSRTGWGYVTLVREVSDSLHLRRFCLIPLGDPVPTESTVRKLTRRLGPELVAQLICGGHRARHERAALPSCGTANRLDGRRGRHPLSDRLGTRRGRRPAPGGGRPSPGGHHRRRRGPCPGPEPGRRPAPAGPRADAAAADRRGA
ncbi:MAG: hypothetical protein ACRDGQ_08675 [Candidatus Limnocylindrales bacterium]